MYLIVVKYQVKPESIEQWPQVVDEFTRAVRDEPGNISFEWSRSLEHDDEYVLVETFTDEGAEPHVQSEHFAKALEDMRPHLVRTPQIISRQVEGEGWEPMDELQV